MDTSDQTSGSRPTIVKTVCPLDCPDTCSMLVTVKDGVAVDLRGDPDHRFTRGFLCQKMARYLERVYSPDRLLQPLRRVGRKGKGRFEPITWDDALAEIAQRFAAIASSAEGPQAILPYSYCGTMGKLQSSSLDRRFFHRLGASKLDRSICASAGSVGYEYTMGRGRLGADPMAVPKCKFIVNWGSNTVNTNSHLWSLMIEARKAGATIATIDPYRSPTASRSDWHIQPRPGTDAALALGVLHVVWRDGLQDDDYLDRATIGADMLRERVTNEYAPDKVAAITGVDVETIERLGPSPGTRTTLADPPQLRLAAPPRRRHGRSHDRLHPRGDRLVAAPRRRGLALDQRHLRFRDGQAHPPDSCRRRARGSINMNQLGEALAGELPGPPVAALYVYNCNPAAVAPNQAKVIKGLEREDLFVVVHELYATDTVDYADIVLPATSQLEHVDIHGAYGHHDVMLNTPAIAPRGECRSNNDVFRELARRLGFEPELFPDDETLIREVLSGGETLKGITLERLREEGPVRLNIPEEFTPFAAGVFPTPSGKCELYSERMKADGFDPLPAYTSAARRPAHPSRSGRSDIRCNWSARRARSSSIRRLPIHRAIARQPATRKSSSRPKMPSERGLIDGQWAEVFNDRGRFLARVSTSGNVRPGVAVATGLYWSKLTRGGANVNGTTSSALTDMGGGATFFDNLVEVRAAAT